jgi:uncharacterized membrane protein
MNINGIMVAGDIAGSSDSNVVVSISGSSPINITPNTLQWATSTVFPVLSQTSSATAAGQALTIQAQGSTGSSTNGGNLVLSSGTSISGTAGNIQLQSGTTTNLTLISTGSLQFGSTVSSPTITQAAASAAGGNLSITAQSAGGTTNNGGSLVLTSGSSSTTGTSGNITINTATPGGSNPGNILFQISGTTQAFVTTNTNGTGLGIGSTPGTSPTITSGSGAPSSTEPNGSVYLNTNLSATGSIVYTRQNGSWFSLPPTGSQIIPLTETINTNTGTAGTQSVYTVDSTNGSDGIILHNHTGAPTTYIMPAPTAGRQIIIRDITGNIETTNQTAGLITGSGTTSNVIFIAPHTTESFNGSFGYSLTGSAYHFTSGSAVVTASSSLFTTELAPGMSIVPVGGTATTTASYIIASIQSSTQFTLTANYTGTTSTTSTAKMNSLAYYANYGTLTLISNGTNWFASSNKPLRAYFTSTITNGVFIPSPGCTSATLIGCGGGGGGGVESGTETGAGGGGALQSVVNVSLTPNLTGGYAVAIGAGGNAGSSGVGAVGGNTALGTIAYFYGASGGGATAGAGLSSGGYPITNNGVNIYSDAVTGAGVASIAVSTTITSTNLPGMIAMGASSVLGASTSGFINIMGNGSYTGGTTTNGGGGGAGPQGSGGNGANAGTAGSGAANTGAGGGGTYGTGTAGAGGSGYLYVILPM